MIKFACDGCLTSYTVPEDRAGKRTTCPKCKKSLIVPAPQRNGPAPSPQVEPAPPQATMETPPVPVKPDSNLGPCPDCNREVSRRAAQCPHCGCPLDQANQAPVTESGPEQHKEDESQPLPSDRRLEGVREVLRQTKAARQQGSAGDRKLQQPTPESVIPASGPTPSSARRWAVLLWVVGGLLLLLACVPAMSLLDPNRIVITESDRAPVYVLGGLGLVCIAFGAVCRSLDRN